MATTPFPTSTTATPSGETRNESKDARATSDAPQSEALRTEAQRADDARRLTERVAQNAHTMVDRAADRIAPAVDRIAPTVDRIRSRVAEAGTAIHRSADQIGELQDRWIDDSRTSIRSHPLTWVAAAFAVGMVIGRMHSGR